MTKYDSQWNGRDKCELLSKTSAPIEALEGEPRADFLL